MVPKETEVHKESKESKVFLVTEVLKEKEVFKENKEFRDYRVTRD